MAELTENVNWVAVLVGTVLSFLIGWLWYSPKLFGVGWAKGSGVELASADQPMSPAPLVIQFLGTFLFSWIVGVTAAGEKLFTAILVIVTIAVLTASTGLFVKKSRYALFTDVGFIIVMGIVMIACQGIL